MSSPRGVCWAMCSLVALHLTILTPGYTFAQDARVSIGFLPINGQPIKGSRETPLFTFELVEPVSRGAMSLPALSLTSTESGPAVSSFTFAFPVLKLGRMSFNPRYGDQKFGVGFLAGSLSGMSLKPLRMQGFSLATAQGDNSFTLMLGQLRGKGSNALSAAVPRVLALTGTLKPRPGLTIAPRVVTHLGRRTLPGSADTSIGAGLRADVSTHLQLVGDIGGARTKRGRWASFATVGALGKWARGSVEASVRRADADYTALGRIRLAKQAQNDEELIAGKVQILQGLTLVTKLRSSRPHGQRHEDVGRVARSITLRIDRFRYGTLNVTSKQSTGQSKYDKGVEIEWQQKILGSSVVRFVQRRERQGSSARPGPSTTLLEFDIKRAPSSDKRFDFLWRGAIAMSGRAADKSRVHSIVKSHFRLTARIKLTGEAEYDLFGMLVPVRFQYARVGGDFEVSERTSVQLVYSQTPLSGVPSSHRLEGRVTRLISF